MVFQLHTYKYFGLLHMAARQDVLPGGIHGDGTNNGTVVIRWGCNGAQS
ncbi:MAG: hypothetical protein OJF51_000702 [Nitrospira sp.]|nr:MAG: hypothetical protein OJF51_000702 [Nitrospira sp.]